MIDLTYSPNELSILRSLLNQSIEYVVWDVNAFYFNTSNATIKLECLADFPEGGAKYDEICYTKILKLEKKLNFVEDHEKYSFKIIALNTKISTIQIIQAWIKFPKGELIQSGDDSNHTYGLHHVSLGLAIDISGEVIPAYILKNNFGFLWQEKQTMYKWNQIVIEEPLECIILT